MPGGGVPNVPAVGTADCKSCKRHFIAISAALFCLSGILLMLKVDNGAVFNNTVKKAPGKKVGLVLARGGSKELPQKNVALINNRTLLRRSLTEMQRSYCFDELWVSTDDDDIAYEASRAKVNVHKRPQALAEDDTPSVDAVFEFFEKHPGIKMIGLVQCTSPFIKARWLREGCDKMFNPQYRFDSVLSVTRYKFLRWEENGDGAVTSANFELSDRPRRQDWDGDLVENGMFYFATANVIKSRRLQGDRVGYVEVPANHSLEVDTVFDLVVAQFLATFLDPNVVDPD